MKRMTVYGSSVLQQQVRAAALAEGISVSEYIRRRITPPPALPAPVPDGLNELTANVIVDWIKKHPGCIKNLFDEETQHLVDESLFLDPEDWEDTTDCIESLYPGEQFWENWNPAITYADGVRCSLIPGQHPTFEET